MNEQILIGLRRAMSSASPHQIMTLDTLDSMNMQLVELRFWEQDFLTASDPFLSQPQKTLFDILLDQHFKINHGGYRKGERFLF